MKTTDQYNYMQVFNSLNYAYAALCYLSLVDDKDEKMISLIRDLVIDIDELFSDLKED